MIVAAAPLTNRVVGSAEGAIRLGGQGDGGLFVFEERIFSCPPGLL
jgi:hypothetical protein